jgi:hypothetical protein
VALPGQRHRAWCLPGCPRRHARPLNPLPRPERSGCRRVNHAVIWLFYSPAWTPGLGTSDGRFAATRRFW